MKINKTILVQVATIAFILFFPLASSAQWSLPQSYGLPTGTIYYIIENILMWLLAIFGFIGIIGFAISGIMYLLSAGSSGMAENAKKGMIYSIIGIVVGLGGFVIIQAIDAMLSGYNSNF
jgi:hypothetical protein